MKLKERFLKDDSGFTLVEMIVVTVIIGILLSVLVPGMTRYIDRAKDSQMEVNARAVYLAYQTELMEEYAKGNVTDAAEAKAIVDARFTSDYIEGLVGIESEAVYAVSDVKISPEAAVSEFTYSEGSRSVLYKNGAWEIK